MTGDLINSKRVQNRLNSLSQFGRDKDGGWSRLAFSPEYFKALDHVKAWMEEAGMTIRLDNVGNLIGHLKGRDESAPVVAAGSHIDTVRNGGMFDGTVGVVAAMEVAQAIKEKCIDHKHPIEVIVFAEEEGARFNKGMLGSRYKAGIIELKDVYSAKDNDGVSFLDALKSYGIDLEKCEDARVTPGYYKAYFEVHIEQGNVLDTHSIALGIVEGISAPHWLKLTLTGSADHAGATPMQFRRDALMAAAEIGLATESYVKEISESSVATIGKLLVYPGGINIVPGKVEMYFDIRDIDEDRRDRIVAYLKSNTESICGKRNIQSEMIELQRLNPVLLPSHMVSLLEKAAQEVEIDSYKRMISGASHDAQAMTEITDVGMLFTPSKDGLSHSSEEHTDIEDILLCTKVLYNGLLKIALGD